VGSAAVSKVEDLAASALVHLLAGRASAMVVGSIAAPMPVSDATDTAAYTTQETGDHADNFRQSHPEAQHDTSQLQQSHPVPAAPVGPSPIGPETAVSLRRLDGVDQGQTASCWHQA
jgi:hypothetical protein